MRGQGPETFNDDTVYFVGYAQVPEMTLTGSLRRFVSIGLLVDAASSLVLDAGCTLETDIARRFFIYLVVGRRLDDGVEPVVADIRRRYHGAAQKALCVSFAEATNKYYEWRRKGSVG